MTNTAWPWNDAVAVEAQKRHDRDTLGATAAVWPNVTREQEHRAIDAAWRLGMALGLPASEVWRGAGLS